MGVGSAFGLGIIEAQISSRVSELVRQIGGSGLLMQPSEADLASPELRPLLERYMHGADIGVDEKSRLFRLGWDLTISAFGMRQELYEYWHRGDITRNRTNLYLRYNRTAVTDRIKELISKPLASPNGIVHSTDDALDRHDATAQPEPLPGQPRRERADQTNPLA
jgi:4-hydroxyphenylacetate 3-monooxygenase